MSESDVLHDRRGPTPVWLIVPAYLVLTGLLVWFGMRLTNGTFVYAQDDPYIHLSMARTLATFGVWGISSNAFASASSSPLWTLLLAMMRRAGATAVWWPLVLNMVAGVVLLVLVDRILRSIVDARWRLATLAAIVLVTPLPTLAIIGMEHTLYIVLAIGVAWRVSEALADEGPGRWGLIVLLSALLVATRYEGLFVVAAAAALLAASGRYWRAAALSAAGAIPVVLFGIYSMVHGGLFLPNSLLMKSGPGRFSSVGAGVAAVASDWFAVINLFGRPPQLMLTIAALLALALPAAATGVRSRGRILATLFVIVSLLHACLVKLEWFFRYEAYLMALGLLAVVVLLAEPSLVGARRARPSIAATAMVILIAIPLVVRTLSALAVTPVAMRNVYEQQYQLGRFFREEYPGAVIAVNDIGVVSWMSSSPIVDVVGLATQEVAERKRQRQFDVNTLRELTYRRRVAAIAIYEKVFAPIIPRDWLLVGEWTIRGNVAVSEETVGFYARNADDAVRLRQALDRFMPILPKEVIYRPVLRTSARPVASVGP